MRGAPSVLRDGGIRVGIIPADAGSTSRRPAALLAAKDHPRGCGEHGAVLAADDWAGGSSPRMRGAQSHDPKLHAVRRIIPADAGSTDTGNTLQHSAGDHPRGCGEHYGIRINAMSYGGSSPRMRGARDSFLAVCGFDRIIPADAGSTSA